jgi:hypothetical protein
MEIFALGERRRISERANDRTVLAVHGDLPEHATPNEQAP